MDENLSDFSYEKCACLQLTATEILIKAARFEQDYTLFKSHGIRKLFLPELHSHNL